MSHDIYIFGSTVRGEVAPDSDIDVLVVPGEGVAVSDYPPTWSVYSRDTLTSYFAEGRLFAWHLYLESRVIFSATAQPWLQSIGAPAQYKTAKADIESLGDLLGKSLSEIQRGTPSLVYEMGLVYTALRDIAMSASWKVMGKPCFSRRAPYLLPLLMPLAEDVYNQTMAARHASTRGTLLPKNIEAYAVRVLSSELGEWVENVKEML